MRTRPPIDVERAVTLRRSGLSWKAVAAELSKGLGTTAFSVDGVQNAVLKDRGTLR